MSSVAGAVGRGRGGGVEGKTNGWGGRFNTVIK